MTVSAIDYRPDSAAAPAPVVTAALSAAVTLMLVLQCVAGGLAIYPAVDFLPWKLAVSFLTVLGVAGLPTLAILGFVALRHNAPGAERAMGRFLRFSTYAFALSFLASLGLEPRYIGIGSGAYLVTVLRGICEVGLICATFVSLGRSQTVLETCGSNFAARVADAMLRMIATDGAVAIILMLASLVLVLAYNALPSVGTFGWHFLTSTDWRDVQYNDDGDVTLPPAFGALTAIYGTVVTSAIALACAAPVSIGAALFLARIVPRMPAGWPRWLLSIASFLIEFLAAIPSIAYGIWGMFVLAPFLAQFIEPGINRLFGAVPGLHWMHMRQPPTGRDLLCAGVVLAIMILPIITAVSRDVLASVPRTQIEGTLALGATWWQSCWGMLRYAKSGLFGAVMLGLARAAGETMAVAMVLSDSNAIGSWFAPGRTMSSVLANEFGEADSPIYRGSLVEVALILLVMSLAFNIVARSLVVGRKSAGVA